MQVIGSVFDLDFQGQSKKSGTNMYVSYFKILYIGIVQIDTKIKSVMYADSPEKVTQ